MSRSGLVSIQSHTKGHPALTALGRAALAAEMASAFGAEERGRLAVEMQQTVLDDNAYVFCAFLRMSMIARAGVTGLRAHPCDYYEITAELDIQ